MTRLVDQQGSQMTIRMTALQKVGQKVGQRWGLDTTANPRVGLRFAVVYPLVIYSSYILGFFGLAYIVGADLVVTNEIARCIQCNRTFARCNGAGADVAYARQL